VGFTVLQPRKVLVVKCSSSSMIGSPPPTQVLEFSSWRLEEAIPESFSFLEHSGTC
jgi:hypothetical protein